MAATSLTPAQTRTQAVGFMAECSLAGLRQRLPSEVADPCQHTALPQAQLSFRLCLPRMGRARRPGRVGNLL